MKKVLTAVIIIAALGFGGYKWYELANYGGQTYYTKVTTSGTRIKQREQNGQVHADYRYKLLAYDDHGQARTLAFNANKSRPLRQGAYLKLVYNPHKGVTSWEAVDSVDLPQPAQKHFE